MEMGEVSVCVFGEERSGRGMTYGTRERGLNDFLECVF
jgi:hypothetical protein